MPNGHHCPVSKNRRQLQSEHSCCAVGGRACALPADARRWTRVLTGEDLGAEQELELVQELLGGAVAGDGRLVRLLGDDGQVGDRVEVVLVPAGPGAQPVVPQLSAPAVLQGAQDLCRRTPPNANKCPPLAATAVSHQDGSLVQSVIMMIAYYSACQEALLT